MDTKFLKLKILGRDGIIFSGKSCAVTLPAITGEITILPYHMSMLSGIKKGTICITINESGDEKKNIDVESGLVRFVNNECVITVVERVI